MLDPIFHPVNKTHSDRHILATVLGHSEQSPEQGGVAPAHKLDRRAGGGSQWVCSLSGAAAVTTHLCSFGWDRVLGANTPPEERCSKGMDGLLPVTMAERGQS